jgi:predicted DNA-binding transcriptional regulator YafY
MGRNSELIRQWTLLQRLATRRGNTIPALAAELKVTSRTIRRDLDALQSAGFTVYDDSVNGTKFWRLDAKKLIDALTRNALTVPELCALYSSRALVKGIAGAHLLADLQGALSKIEAALPPGMKKFMDRLPSVITAKSPYGKRRGTQTHDVTSRLFEASMLRRVVMMRYFSNESGREKDYTIHPYRLVYAQNALYLQAFVPAYNEFRTFLVDRIRRLSVQEQTFDRVAELGSDPFSKSMGVHTGPTVKVQLRFSRQVAPFVKEHTWHESEQLKDRPDGSVVMTLQVSDDYALRQWILGFGRSVRVLAPATLVEWALEELDEARQQYVSGEPGHVVDSDVQPALPFMFGRITSV